MRAIRFASRGHDALKTSDYQTSYDKLSRAQEPPSEPALEEGSLCVEG